ncbi:MAG: hypothetical protein IAE89_15860 [Anaerolineae bacterium]|nr:hypothetical protein [Anaerolineae bacterium]
MRRGLKFSGLFILIFTVSACNSLPGLRVLTGQDNSQTLADNTVAALDLVMADKTGLTEPPLLASADRIEAASGDVDIIEIRADAESRVFSVNMLFSPPASDASTMEGQVAQLNALRRAIELTWQGTMLDSEGSDVLRVTLLAPQSIQTLDSGESFIGIVVADSSIDRAAAASYLAGSRSLDAFFDLIAQGTLAYTAPSSLELYEGHPNHPMYMLPTSIQ